MLKIAQPQAIGHGRRAQCHGHAAGLSLQMKTQRKRMQMAAVSSAIGRTLRHFGEHDIAQFGEQVKTGRRRP